MPRTYLNSVVFAGREFDVSMFDERALAPMFGRLEKNSVRAGPVGNFTYSNGHYSFQIVPDRIDVRHSGQAVLPDILRSAGDIIIDQLNPVRGLVNAVGINCDAVFSPQEIGRSGKEFCKFLMDSGAFQQLYGDCPNAAVLSVVTVFSGAGGLIQNTVRVEAEPTSGHQDLVVAFNGHQGVSSTDDLKKTLQTIDELREAALGLHQRVLSIGK